MVLGLCRLLLRDPLEAEDAAQQVFLSAHRALLRGSVPRDPPAWLGTIARNECRARIRARMREPLALPELPADLPDPLAAAIRTADLDAVWLALSQLPRRQRRALMLRELGGLSYHELGRALGVSQSAVESLLFRARRHVRSLIAGANAAAVPLALRDELGRLIPDFDPGSVGLAARLASAPVALKLATAAVGIGVVTTGASQVPGRRTVEPRAHSAGHAAAVARRPTRRAVTAALVAPPVSAARTAGPSEQAGRRRVRRHAETIHADGDGNDTEAATSRGPAPAEPEADHSGPGPGMSTQPAQPLTATVELEVESHDGHDGSGSSGSSDGGGTDVRSDSGD
jgi:RNA polymerase sigma factor (sigma-70 family)